MARQAVRLPREVKSLSPAPHLRAVLPWVLLMLPLGCAPSVDAQPRQAVTSVPAAEVLDVEQYAAMLEQWRQDVASLEQSPERSAALRQSLPAHWEVRHGTQTFPIPTDWLASALSDYERQRGQRERLRKFVQVRLEAMREQAELLRGEQRETSLAPIQARLDDILSRREFRSLRQPNWFDRLQARLSLWLLDLLERLFRRLDRYPAAGSILVWSVITFSFIVLTLWVVRHLRHVVREPVFSLTPETATILNWEERIARARAAAQRGDHRAAIHHAYWAAVLRLEQAGLWKFERARTPREYLSLLERNHVSRPALLSLTRRFELTWYGSAPASSADYQDVLALLEKLGCQFTWSPGTAQS